MGACDKNQIKGVAFTDWAKIRIQISQGINKQTVGQTLYNHICTDCSGLVGKKINPPPGGRPCQQSSQTRLHSVLITAAVAVLDAAFIPDTCLSAPDQAARPSARVTVGAGISIRISASTVFSPVPACLPDAWPLTDCGTEWGLAAVSSRSLNPSAWGFLASVRPWIVSACERISWTTNMRCRLDWNNAKGSAAAVRQGFRKLRAWDAPQGVCWGLSALRRDEVTHVTVGYYRYYNTKTGDSVDTRRTTEPSLDGDAAAGTEVYWQPARASVENRETWHAQEKRGNAALASLNHLFCKGSLQQAWPNTFDEDLNQWHSCPYAAGAAVCLFTSCFQLVISPGNSQVDRCSPHFM